MPRQLYGLPVSTTTIPQKVRNSAIDSELRGRFFSGSAWQKAGDILSIGQYGLAGATRELQREYGPNTRVGLKEALNPRYWQTFGRGLQKGIQERASFEDVLAERGWEEGAKRMGTGLALDIALDPLSYIGFGTLARMGAKIPGVKKVTGLASKLTPTAIEALKGSRLARFLPAEKLYPGLSKAEKAMEEATRMRQAGIITKVREAGKGLGRAEKRAMGWWLEHPEGAFKTPVLPGAKTLAEEAFEAGLKKPTLTAQQQLYGQMLRQLPEGLSTRLKPLKELATKMGLEEAELGLIPKKTLEKYGGRYMPHVWLEAFERAPTGAKVPLVSKAPKYSGKFFQHRAGVPGFMREFELPMTYGLGTAAKDIEMAKFTKEIAEKYGVKALSPQRMSELAEKGYKLAKGISPAKGGELLNKTLLPEQIINYLKAVRPTENKAIQAYEKALNWWKKGKTIWNPAYHFRNLMSNQILAEMSTGGGPTQLVRYGKAIQSYFGKGTGAKYAEEMAELGGIKKNLWSKTVNELAEEAISKTGKKTSAWQKIDPFSRKVQDFMEDTAKVSVYSFWRDKGLSKSDALAKAEEAIFSPYRISAAERTWLGKFIPFYSFTRQALPYTMKTAYEYPGRISKYRKAERMMERRAEREGFPTEAQLPEWQKGMIPVGKDKYGRPRYLQAQYIYPWGQFLESGITPGGGVSLPFGLSPTPFAQFPAEVAAGKEFYFGMPIEGVGGIAQQAARTFLPTLPWNLATKLLPTAIRGTDIYEREREVPEIISSDIFGIKTYPYEKAKAERSIRYEEMSPIYKQRDKIKSLIRKKNEAVTEKAKAHYSVQIKEEQKKLQELLRSR